LKQGCESEWIDATTCGRGEMLRRALSAADAEEHMTTAKFIVEGVATDAPKTPKEIQRRKIVLFAKAA
jgi:hypothetical protein